VPKIKAFKQQYISSRFLHFVMKTVQQIPLLYFVMIMVFVAISEAARAGYAVLTGGGSALDAVEAAVVCMENCPIFNAGE